MAAGKASAHAQANSFSGKVIHRPCTRCGHRVWRIGRWGGFRPYSRRLSALSQPSWRARAWWL